MNMPTQLDLSRVSVTRQIAREQHWIARMLMAAFAVFVLGYSLFIGCRFAYVLGKFLNSITEAGEQARFMCAVSALLWLGGAHLLALHCHWCFFESPELPQFLTMPLTTLQIFRRSLPAIVKTTALTLPLIGILWVPFIGGYEGWHSSHFRAIPLLVILQGLLNLTIPPFIAMAVYHLHQRVTHTVVAVGFIAAGLVAFQIAVLHDQPGALAWCDPLLRNPVVQTFINVCPGAWIARLFLAGGAQSSASFAVWAGLIVAVSAVGALAVACQVSHGYTEDVILAKQERRWSIVEPRQPGEKPRGRVSLLRSPFSFLDPLYERLFTSRQRAIIALVFQDTFEGQLGKRAGQVALLGVSLLFLVAVVQLLLPHFSTHTTGKAAPPVLVMILICSSCFCMSPWFPGHKQNMAQAGLRRGSLQVPLLEIVPWEPREFFGTCFRFLSLLALVTWACLLPACAAAVLGTHDLGYIALAPGLLGLFLEMVFLTPIFASSGAQRDPSRTVEGEVSSYLIMVLIAIVCVAAAAAAIFCITMLLESLGMLEVAAMALSVVFVFIAADILSYLGWLKSYQRRNFDIDPRDPSAMTPSWMMRR